MALSSADGGRSASSGCGACYECYLHEVGLSGDASRGVVVEEAGESLSRRRDLPSVVDGVISQNRRKDKPLAKK